MIKKAMSLILALALALGVSGALADPVTIDKTADRGITIQDAGLNASAADVIAEGYSPTTGRKLDEIEAVPDSFYGTVKSGKYQPVMVQISNASNGVGVADGKAGRLAPVNATYADVVYESCQMRDGGESRMSMIFSDTIPDYAGFVRSTRLTHILLRQEWDSAFCTSGYSDYYIEKWKEIYGMRPDDSGNKLVFVGGFGLGKEYSGRLKSAAATQNANNELFELSRLMQNAYPQDHEAANHTWLFSDELPEGGDAGEVIYVSFGSKYDTDSRLEYDEETGEYYRYVYMQNGKDQVYRESTLVNPSARWLDLGEASGRYVLADARNFGEDQKAITFSNVIVQFINMDWQNIKIPEPELVGSGNADYFMGGMHYEGAWKRDDLNSRTVYYGADGKEISLRRGRTLIILMDINDSICSVQYE